MTKVIENFIDRIDRDIAKTQENKDKFGIVDLWHVFVLMSLDIIGETAYGQTFHALEDSDHFVPHTIHKNLEIMNYVCTSKSTADDCFRVHIKACIRNSWWHIQ